MKLSNKVKNVLQSSANKAATTAVKVSKLAGAKNLGKVATAAAFGMPKSANLKNNTMVKAAPQALKGAVAGGLAGAAILKKMGAKIKRK